MSSIVLAVCLVGPACAQGAAGEKLSKACDVIYAKLCKGITPGPAQIGKCNRVRPTVGEKVPAKCEADFQSKVEGYEDVKREKRH